MNSKEALEILFFHNQVNVNTKLVGKCCNIIKQDLDRLEKLKKTIVSKKRIQSLRETANPIYEVVLHIPQNLLKEVLTDEK